MPPNEQTKLIKTLPEQVKQFLEDGKKGSLLGKILLIFAFISDPGVLGVFFMVLGFRSWVRRRVFNRLLERMNIDHYVSKVYAPALWSFIWRSGLCCLACMVFHIIRLSLTEYSIRFAVVLMAQWILGSVLVLDVPMWVLRALRRELATINEK